MNCGRRPARCNQRPGMKKLDLTIPSMVAVGATRGMLGMGLGMLLAPRVRRSRRTKLGIALAAVGLLSTIPLALKIFGATEPDHEHS